MNFESIFSEIFSVLKYFGLVAFILVISFSFLKGLKNIINIFFRPYKYFEDNYSSLLKEIIHEKFGTEVDKTIDRSINKASEKIFLPTEKWTEVIEKTVIETLDEVGIKKCINDNKSFRLELNKNLSTVFIVDPDYKKSLIQEIKLNSKKVNASIGKRSKSSYKYYIDFRQVLTNTNVAIQLNNILINFISDYNNDVRPGFDFVAVNRNSNTIFGYLLSNLLEIPLLIVNYDTRRWIIDGKEVKVDGINDVKKPFNIRRGFLVDDAVSGGGILKESAMVLKNKGFIIEDVFVLFSRKEDLSIENFASNNLVLHSIFNLDDYDIKKILNTSDEDLELIINEL